MGKYLIIFLLIAQTGIAQKAAPRDTSFAIQSNYKKVLEKYPQIVIASPGLSKKSRCEKKYSFPPYQRPGSFIRYLLS